MSAENLIFLLKSCRQVVYFSEPTVEDNNRLFLTFELKPQEQVRSGDASSMELFELGAVMLRRKFYPAATKYLLQAIEKWDGDDQDLAQVSQRLKKCFFRHLTGFDVK